jgi:GntR family transcriptional regulator, carbon starvation induced regulator
MKMAPTPREPQSGTVTSMIHAKLRGDIIAAALGPGARLKINEICDVYSVGLAPVREALNRLAQEGLVSHSDHKGFTVAGVSKEDLEDLTKARCWISEIALRQSIEAGDDKWEENIVLSFHRMTRMPRYVDSGKPTPNPDWETGHRKFHSSLLGACPSRRLLKYGEELFSQADRYRSLAAMANVSTMIRSTTSHQEIMDAVLKRDPEVAVNLLLSHYQETCRDLVNHWENAMELLARQRGTSR